MAELRIACPGCGMPLTAPTESELAKVWHQHSKAAHGMEPSEAEAKEKVKQLLAAQSGEYQQEHLCLRPALPAGAG